MSSQIRVDGPKHSQGTQSVQNKGLEGYLDWEEKDQKTIQWVAVGLIAKEIFKYKGLLFLGLITVALGTIAALMEPKLFGDAIDQAIVPKNFLRLNQIGLLFLIAVLVRIGGAVSQGILFEALGQRVTLGLRNQIFEHLQRMPMSFFDRNPAGRLLTRVTNDVESVSEMFSAGFVSMIGNFLLVIGVLVCMLALNWKLALIGLLPFPFLVMVSIHFSRKLRISYREARSKLSALNAFLAENILGMKVVQLFNRQSIHYSRFKRVNQWYADAQILTVKVYALFQPSITLTAAVSLSLLIVFGGREVAHGVLAVGTLVSLFSYALTLFQPLRELADKWNLFLSGMASAERLFSILSLHCDPVGDPVGDPLDQSLPVKTFRGEIEFQGVWFAYDAEHWVLKDFNLKISAGSKVGVVGHTGSGKTTLISLLLRFYEPNRGKILVDGQDIQSIPRHLLRLTIGLIQQEPFLFSGSVEENMTFWRGAPKHPLTIEILNAYRKANQSSANGLDSESNVNFKKEVAWLEKDEPIRERGQNISLGQKQLLAFARVIEKSPSIWILDEATANMDSETESYLQEVLSRATKGATSLLIAHRLATVKTADLIVVLNKGVLLEKGSHQELIDLGGLYSRLVHFQKLKDQNEAHLLGSKGTNQTV